MGYVILLSTTLKFRKLIWKRLAWKDTALAHWADSDARWQSELNMISIRFPSDPKSDDSASKQAQCDQIRVLERCQLDRH